MKFYIVRPIICFIFSKMQPDSPVIIDIRPPFLQSMYLCHLTFNDLTELTYLCFRYICFKVFQCAVLKVRNEFHLFLVIKTNQSYQNRHLMSDECELPRRNLLLQTS